MSRHPARWVDGDDDNDDDVVLKWPFDVQSRLIVCVLVGICCWCVSKKHFQTVLDKWTSGGSLGLGGDEGVALSEIFLLFANLINCCVAKSVHRFWPFEEPAKCTTSYERLASIFSSCPGQRPNNQRARGNCEKLCANCWKCSRTTEYSIKIWRQTKNAVEVEEVKEMMW